MGLNWKTFFVAGLSAIGGIGSANDHYGLTVGLDGTLLAEGRPFRGIGVNYVPGDLTGSPAVPVPEVFFPQLAVAGIPFARIMFNGYDPNELPQTSAQWNKHYTYLDRLVNAAEKSGVGLVVDFFW